MIEAQPNPLAPAKEFYNLAINAGASKIPPRNGEKTWWRNLYISYLRAHTEVHTDQQIAKMVELNTRERVRQIYVATTLHLRENSPDEIKNHFTKEALLPRF